MPAPSVSVRQAAPPPPAPNRAAVAPRGSKTTGRSAARAQDGPSGPSSTAGRAEGKCSGQAGSARA
jgi:hypothetical protein